MTDPPQSITNFGSCDGLWRARHNPGAQIFLFLPVVYLEAHFTKLEVWSPCSLSLSCYTLSLSSYPFSLPLLLSLLTAWCSLYLFRFSNQPLVILGCTFSDRETLGILVVSTIVRIFLTTVGSLLISASLIGVIVCVHGAFRVPEDLFLDDQEPTEAGFLSFLGGAATSAADAPAVAGRVWFEVRVFYLIWSALLDLNRRTRWEREFFGFRVLVSWWVRILVLLYMVLLWLQLSKSFSRMIWF